MEKHLGQRARLLMLAVEVAILLATSKFATGRWFPASDDRGFWFYTALLGLILSRRLDAPFYPTPADVILYAAPAAITLALVNRWTSWGSGERLAFFLALCYCIITAFVGLTAILTKDSHSLRTRRLSDSARLIVQTIGTARVVYSIVLAFSLYTFHRTSIREFGAITIAWIITCLLSPLESTVLVSRRIIALWASGPVGEDGSVVAYQSPGIVLVREARHGSIGPGDVLAVQDPVKGAHLVIALDAVGRDEEGLLRRSLELTDVPTNVSPELVDGLSAGAVRKVDGLKGPSQERVIRDQTTLAGLVTADTTVERLYFEVVRDVGLEQGRLLETTVAERTVTYQLLDGLTREEVVQKKNTHGFSRAQAQQLGEWDAAVRRFRIAKWLPSMNAPVYLKTTTAFTPERAAIGHYPGTDYGVTLNDIDALVTYNTAILGILGVGKTTLALELVERMIDAGVSVICVDLTNQYLDELVDSRDAERDTGQLAALQKVGAEGKTNVERNVAEGGSRQAFGKALLEDIDAFLATTTKRLKVYNPSEFEVWRQDSKPFENKASMVQLTSAEVTHLISEATLRAVAKRGFTDRARVCLVYEEAHSLVPEWSSVVSEGDRAATNGSARAILQGRKYGLGCLLITQRTANVTKTILNQCHTIFAMRTFDETGKEFLGNYLGKEHAGMLSTIEERHAVVFGKALSCENPVLIRLNDRDEFKRVFRSEAVARQRE